MQPVSLEVAGLSKRYDRVQALDAVTVEFRGGEIHALLGENGAGKTTLMNVVYGLTSPDRGTLTLNGRRIRPSSPRQARRLGIGMVHQHFTVVDRLTTAENLALSLPGQQLRYRPSRAADEALRLAGRIGLDVGDPHARASSLAVGTRQRIEILKALAQDARVLILDEPTAVLTPDEVAQLFSVLDRLRAEGRAVVFITHKLGEARAISDRITVLRAGRVAGHGVPLTLSDADLAVMMVGTPITTSRPARAPQERELLRFEDVPLAAGAARGVSFAVRAGEVFGVVGVDGNGQTELFRLLAGMDRPAAGRMLVKGKPVEGPSPAAVLAAGIGLIPPDRRSDGLVPAMSVGENLLLSRLLLRSLSRCGILRRRAARRFAAEQVRRYQIQTPSVDTPVSSLSGGNQQRLVIARALAGAPDVLVAVNPTRGLDIGAARSVYGAIDSFVTAGKGVLLISTDLDEVLQISDRIGVLYRRQMEGPLLRPFDSEQVGLMMAGIGGKG